MAKWLLESRTARLLAFAGSTLTFGLIFLTVAAAFENPAGWLLSQRWLIVTTGVVALPLLVIGRMWRTQFAENGLTPTWLAIAYLAVMSWFLAGLTLLLSSMGVSLVTGELVRLFEKAATFALVSWLGARVAVAMAAVTCQSVTPPEPPPA